MSQVIVKGAHILEYLHRLHVSVDGGVEIVSIAFQNQAVSLNPKQNFNIYNLHSGSTINMAWYVYGISTDVSVETCEYPCNVA